MLVKRNKDILRGGNPILSILKSLAPHLLPALGNAVSKLVEGPAAALGQKLGKLINGGMLLTHPINMSGLMAGQPHLTTRDLTDGPPFKGGSYRFDGMTGTGKIETQSGRLSGGSGRLSGGSGMLSGSTQKKSLLCRC